MLDKPGTDDAREVYTAATWIQSSRLLAPEAYAAVARARRSHRVSSGGAARALDLLRTLLAQVEPVEFDASLAERAGELSTTLTLRGYDAIHLASYEIVKAVSSVLVAADGDLAHAARSRGHAVAVPGR